MALLAFVAVMVSSVAFAGMGVHLNVNIPFAFYVEDQLLPAGEYSFEMGGSSIVIRAKDGKGVRLLTTINSVNENKSSDFLQFNQAGDKLFLSSVAAGSYKASVKAVKTEREVKAQIEKVRQVTFAAKK